MPRKKLLLNTRLDPSLETAGYSNSYWMARAHLGLAFICFDRNDAAIAASHIMRVFLCDPRNSRKTLFVPLYTHLFEPQCENIHHVHSQAVERLERELQDEKRKVETALTEQLSATVAKSLLLIHPIGWLIAAFDKKLRVNSHEFQVLAKVITEKIRLAGKESWKKEEIKEVIQSAIKDHFAGLQHIRLNRLDLELQSKLDQRCKEIALTYTR